MAGGACGGDGAKSAGTPEEVQIMPKSRKATAVKAVGQLARKGARKSAKPTKPQQRTTAAAKPTSAEASPPAAPARRSKKAAILALLQQPDGAAIGDLIDATGW
jgi:hypothetical protein